MLSLTGAKDPDEFIKARGAEAFRRLLEGSAGRVDFRLHAIQEKHDLTSAEGKVEYLKAAAALLAKLHSGVEREVYALRVAEQVGVSKDAVLADLARLRKQNLARAKKQEERDETRPVRAAQPKERALRYDDPRSAKAEEGIIRLLFLEPGLFRNRELPEPEQFSSPVLARYYRELRRRTESGAPISLDAMTGELHTAELSHLSAILQERVDLSRGEKALADYIHIIESRKTGTADANLRDLAEIYRKTKGYGG